MKADCQQLTRCKDCPHGFARMVGSRGNPASPLVVVGESPGKEEVKAGVPFVGPSGKVLEHALAQHPDITPLFLNAFQCYPGSVANKSQDRLIEATHRCQQRLHTQIQEHPRSVILALGNPAVWSTTNEFHHKITRVRGKLFPSGLAQRGVVAAVHPAFLLRGGGSARQFMGDVDFACRLVQGASPKRYVLPEMHVATSKANIEWLARQISPQPWVAADIETGGYSGFDPYRDRILAAGFCWDPAHVYVVPEHLIPYTRLLFATRTKFVWHNGKFDMEFFWAQNIKARVDEDTLALSYALDETRGIHDLEQVAGDLLGAPDWKFMIQEYLDDWRSKHRKQQLPGYDPVPRPILHDYMSRDISGTAQVFPILRNAVRQDKNLEKLYTKTLLPIIPYFARIEMIGITPDLERIQQNSIRLGKAQEEASQHFNDIALSSGYHEMNPSSPTQIAPFLYDHLKLRDPRRPKKRPDSTDEKTLLSLPPHPAVKALLAYREIQKGLSTYVDNLPDHIGHDNRVHTTYLFHGTTTGRPASRNPNLLNIPREPAIRGQFVASPDKILMEVDVNQAELRVLAELSRDKELIHIYTTPGHPSIHKVTQYEMFGDPQTYHAQKWLEFMDKFSCPGNKERTLKEQNMRAKCVNFGIVYGRTAGSIADEFKMPTPEAQEWINKWFRKYAGAHEFIMRCRAAPLKGQNLVTPFGRKRRFLIVGPEKLTEIQNQCANFPEQSIASDITTHVGMEIQEEAYESFDALIVNTIYDSLLFELPNDLDKALELGCKVLRRLEDLPKRWGLTLIPFKGEIKIGTRWGEDPEHPEEGYLHEVSIPQHLKAQFGL